jgi:hypothetical protein
LPIKWSLRNLMKVDYNKTSPPLDCS